MGKTFTAKYKYRKDGLTEALDQLSHAYNLALFVCENTEISVEVRKSHLRSVGVYASIVNNTVRNILQENTEDDDSTIRSD